MKKIKLWLIVLLISLVVGSCKSVPEAPVEYKETLSLVPAKPFDLIPNPTTKDDYRKNYNTMLGYAQELEDWIFTEYPDAKREGSDEKD